MFFLKQQLIFLVINSLKLHLGKFFISLAKDYVLLFFYNSNFNHWVMFNSVMCTVFEKVLLIAFHLHFFFVEKPSQCC